MDVYSRISGHTALIKHTQFLNTHVIGCQNTTANGNYALVSTPEAFTTHGLAASYAHTTNKDNDGDKSPVLDMCVQALPLKFRQQFDRTQYRIG